MKKSRVDMLIALIKDIEKVEAKELTDRLAREHHIWLSWSIPTKYIAEPIESGRLLKDD